MRGVRAQIRNEFSPFASGDFNLGDGCNQGCNLVPHDGRLRGECAHARLLHVLLEHWLKLDPQVLVSGVLLAQSKQSNIA